MIIGVVGNPEYEGLRALLARLTTTAPQSDVSFHGEASLSEFWPDPVPELDLDGNRPDVVMCLGGDGTLLRTARLVGPREIPVLGLKIGRIGFLTTATPDDLDAVMRALTSGAYQIESRCILGATITDQEGKVRGKSSALNDVVVHKAGVARVIRLHVQMGEEEIGAFSSDGLIVATPTGSTAYSLSAGGPIVVPNADALVVTPICPHTLAVRPIVVRGESIITIDVLPPRGDGEVLVSYDGQLGETLQEHHRVVVRRTDYRAQLIRLGREGFFARMRRQLQWGDLTDRDRGQQDDRRPHGLR
jgi:NAD+ kinase